MPTEQSPCVITAEFVARWERDYDTRKYPADFYLQHTASARNAKSAGELKEALLALLHWKDGKASSYVPGRIHAKNLGPINSLGEPGLLGLAGLFHGLMEAGDEDFTRRMEDLRNILVNMWNSVVLPAFMLHVARPDRLPIIDRHTVRAYLWLTRGQFVEEPTITWELWGHYATFFQGAVVGAGFNSDAISRSHVDRALFAYGKWLKESYPREKEKLLRERALTTPATEPGFTSLWEQILAETAGEKAGPST